MDGQFISGIFNYCDRWCERCPFTSRCRTFAMEQEFLSAERERRDPRDIDWEDFWRRVGLSFERTPHEWLAEDDFEAEEPEYELGITFRSADDDRLIEQDVDSHPLNMQAHNYTAAAHRWLNTHASGWVQGQSDGLDPRAAGDALIGDQGEDNLDLDDALAVISWYHTLLTAKLNRAIYGLLESQCDSEPWGDAFDEDSWDGEDLHETIREADAADAAGSAKVALISIERSIGAWTIIRTARPDLASSIAPLQQMLGRLRIQIDQLIPAARTFHRPGLDD